VLITLDTTRADHLGAYGYANARTPNFDRLAADGVLYEHAYATSSWTLPSHASILTGLLPMQHGAQTAAGASSEQLGYGVRPLSERFTTLAERLRTAGYRTGAVVGGPALGHELGTGQGFETYVDALDKDIGEDYTGKRAEQVADIAAELVRRFGEEPFFLFVNFFDPHAPYLPPPPHDRGLSSELDPKLAKSLLERLVAGEAPRHEDQLEDWERRAIAGMIAGYDAEIAYMDHHLGRLLAALAAAPRASDTLIAITSDHGESFGEHNHLSHGTHLYEDNIRVPLVLVAPGGAGAGERIPEPVQNHRLFTTLLAAAGIAPGNGFVAPALGGPREPIVTEVGRSEANVRMFGPYFDRDLRAIYAPPYKLITSTRGPPELFDLEGPAGEYENLAQRQPDVSGALRARLDRIVSERVPLYAADDRAKLSPETEKALRALGYLD